MIISLIPIIYSDSIGFDTQINSNSQIIFGQDNLVCYLDQNNIFTGINYFSTICLNNECITEWNITSSGSFEIDGGFANSVYLASQVIDGGSAS